MVKWEEKRLRDFVAVNPPVKLTRGTQYPFIEIDKVERRYKYVINAEIKKYDSQGCSKFEDGDTVFSRITPCLENRKIAKTKLSGDKKGFGSTEFFVFREKKDLSDKDFVYYLVSSDEVVKPAINSMTGASGRQRADRVFIEKLKLLYPPLIIQKRIAAVLSAYDDLIENNNRRIELLEKAAQEIYKEWFVRFRFPGYEHAKFVNGLPEGWKIIRLKEIVNRLPFGRLYKPDELEQEGKVIVIDQSRDEYLGFHNDEPAYRATYDNPIILFGDHSCKIELMTREFSLAENVVPFISSGKTSVFYLYYAVIGIIHTTEYKRHWIEFVSKKILLPSLELQNLLSLKVKGLIMAEQTLIKRNQNLQKQRDLLLPRLMSGKLEV